ncbi:uncharacterized protein LOC132038443 [Lycium ferocissimum]|uniref:uncharacterized protein LOC132038443 n=1 Tax=Lycium ferocissimum TaxID=112874 RepID=UPI00281678B9|nr:uncharacterized protein LOC132038443 [Lycium ferocissimum]
MRDELRELARKYEEEQNKRLKEERRRIVLESDFKELKAQVCNLIKLPRSPPPRPDHDDGEDAEDEEDQEHGDDKDQENREYGETEMECYVCQKESESVNIFFCIALLQQISVSIDRLLKYKNIAGKSRFFSSVSKWSRNSIGDVFENVKKFETEVSDAETAYLNSDADADRMLLNKTKAEYIKWLKMEDSILRQKARIKWAEEGDSNTKYFHSTIKARRRRAQIYKIKDRNDHWVEGNANISKVAIDHFSEIFTGNPRDMNLDFIRGCDNLGDPLFPALFIIAAETLSRSLNHLNQNDKFINFSMHKKRPQINHLSYADDLVLFTSADKFSIKLIMNLLRLYQNASGQEINNDKTFFITHSKTNRIYNRRIRRWTGYKQSSFPFTYLGCPIYSGRKRISYFSDISKKVLNKIAGWQGRFLSPGGKATIIKHVLQSQALHIFAALMPPVTSLYEIEMQFANFFWGEKDGKNSYHWSSWDNMSYPTKEGGLGFRSLLDICHTFAAKRWWRLRTEPSLWAQFIRAKYCQRSNLNSKIIAPKDLPAWKDLLHIRDKIEANIN